MFEKTLTDIVKGIRASKRDTALYISQCIAEIKTEINSSDMYVKANALQKLTFLQMMGYGMSWASFATIEVMSSPRFAHKRIGYLAASQGFTQDTEVVLLTTNLLKKELRGAIGGGMNGVYEAGLAINCISNIVTEDLSQDLLPELTNLTSHPQPYLRKKAILCLFKLFVKYPQGLRLTFAQIQQCLSDSNPSVVSCAVNVITELSDKNPKNYLHLAPAFFDLLTTSSNNWMLIKVVKLLGVLVPEEPRLARKLLEPLAGIVRNTPAKSLLYEAVHAITLCLPYCRKSDGSMPASVPDIVTLCAKTLRDFVEDRDQNLKYLGLVGFGSLMQSHPKVLSAMDYRPLILACLSDEDVTIRTRALGLLNGMTSRKNLMELVSQLMQHVELASGSYKLDLVEKIIEMCCGEKYALLQNFSWYLDILFQLGHMRGLDAHAELLRHQVTDVALRVLPVRAYAVKRSIDILLEGDQGYASSVVDLDGDNGRGKHIMPEILPAIAWIIGEYSDLIPDAVSMDSNAVYIFDENSEGPYHSVIQAVTAPSNSTRLPTSTQKIYIQAGMKVFAAATSNRRVSEPELEACARTLASNLLIFVQSTDVEVQERALSSYSLMKSFDLVPNALQDGLPGLTATYGDDGSESSGDAEEGNLLSMPHSDLPSATSVKQKLIKGEVKGQGLAKRCRNASEILNFLFKPSPMKPTSAKAQRKKYQSFPAVDIDLDATVDLSIFAALIEEENNQRASSRLSMETVSFTQQRPLRLQEPAVIDALSSADLTQNTAGGVGPADIGNLMGSSSSFQRSNMQELGSDRSHTTSRPQTASDPFYLSAAPSVLDSEEGPNVQSRFGAIELGDGDSEEEVEESKLRKKKKKTKKDKRHKAAILPMKNDVPAMTSAMGVVTVYDSDDEDDDEHRQNAGRRATGRKTNTGKEFSGLAKVDLTVPLRDDEVMPERKHRVVPDRTFDEQLRPQPSQKKEKKKKKESKRNKNLAISTSEEGKVAGGVGDLLDLGGFAMAPYTTSVAEPAARGPSLGSIMSNKSNPINNAFDDLLGLATPVSVPQVGALSMQTSLEYTYDSSLLASPEVATPKPGKRPWMRATIKTSHATGSPVVNWSKVSLLFRVSNKDVDGGASFVVRVENHMETSTLSGLVLQIKGRADIHIGQVSPGSAMESGKIGPFSYPQTDDSFDLKGMLITSECSVPVKLSLPASLHLSPKLGLVLEDIAKELSTSEWSSHTAKLDILSGIAADQVKPLLSSFLRAGEVEPGSSGPWNGTFAAESSFGTQVRVLVKVKKDSVKIDVKSKSQQLGKALASDLKKLVL